LSLEYTRTRSKNRSTLASTSRCETHLWRHVLWRLWSSQASQGQILGRSTKPEYSQVVGTSETDLRERRALAWEEGVKEKTQAAMRRIYETKSSVTPSLWVFLPLSRCYKRHAFCVYFSIAHYVGVRLVTWVWIFRTVKCGHECYVWCVNFSVGHPRSARARLGQNVCYKSLVEKSIVIREANLLSLVPLLEKRDCPIANHSYI
jgi:hypothetical protein